MGAAIEVHRELGPGLLELTYEACLFYELTQRGLDVKLPITHKGVDLDQGYMQERLARLTLRNH